MTKNNSSLVFVAFAILFTFTTSVPLPNNFKLIILHNNDLHGRFEQTGLLSDKCRSVDAKANKCFGGFARIAHKVREFRKKAEAGEIPKILYLNAGDTYTGTPWFSVYKERITSDFLNLLQPDAISLGNHEFDEGIASLGNFLRQVNFPVLMANLKLVNEPDLETRSLKASIVIEIAGRKVGVIGYLTGQTKEMVEGRGVVFLDEVVSINEEAQKLRQEGVNVIIALGHSGFERDKEIAAQCNDVDLVVGGHSHTFLYTGNPPNTGDVADGEYPIIITRDNGKRVPVVQAYAFGKFLGYMEVEFDDQGNLVEFNGNPILLDGSVPQDNDALALLEKYRPGVAISETQVLGLTNVLLDGNCRRQECNLGNFLTDSMVDFLQSRNFSDVYIALLEGGGIRASISYDESEGGEITMEDGETAIPFKNYMVIVSMNGKKLKEVLEHSVHLYDDQQKRGEFLQVAGLQVTYDVAKPPGQRVVAVKVRSGSDYECLQKNRVYRVIVTEYLANGGDGFEMMRSLARSTIEVLDISMFVEYLQKKSPINPKIEDRINFMNHETAAKLNPCEVSENIFL